LPLSPQTALNGGQEEGAARRSVHQLCDLISPQINVVQYDEGLFGLQSVPHLNGGRLVGSFALIESVKELQEQIIYGFVADR
jgi:hypothetical protein